jgi:hypothetical protein
VEERERRLTAGVADLAAVIERAGADLSLAEEPSGFLLALDAVPAAEPDDSP